MAASGEYSVVVKSRNRGLCANSTDSQPGENVGLSLPVLLPRKDLHIFREVFAGGVDMCSKFIRNTTKTEFNAGGIMSSGDPTLAYSNIHGSSYLLRIPCRVSLGTHVAGKEARQASATTVHNDLGAVSGAVSLHHKWRCAMQAKGKRA